MNILVVCQHYWPEPFVVADMCETLMLRGHEVAVLTGLPNYPEGELYPGYEKPGTHRQVHNGVDIYRAEIVPRKSGVVHRMINYYSFSLHGSRLAKRIDFDADVVLVYQTSPVMMANPALAYAERTGVPVLLYCVDIWPECLVAGGIRQGSLVYNYFKRVSRLIYSRVDALAVTSPFFADYFRDVLRMDSMGDVLYLPQYAEEVFDGGVVDRPEGYDPSKTNLTFAGNVGSAQSVETVVRAASLLKDRSDLAFHIVGSGTELESCEVLAEELDVENVVFHGRKPFEDMPAFYAASDAMIATFANTPLLGYTLPRKMQSYMAAGKPVVAAALGETKRVIDLSGCGLCCGAEDFDALAALFVEISEMSPAELSEYGESGRSYFESKFSKEGFFDVLEGKLDEMKGIKHGRHAGI